VVAHIHTRPAISIYAKAKRKVKITFIFALPSANNLFKVTKNESKKQIKSYFCAF
jgi:hypothetical protein